MRKIPKDRRLVPSGAERKRRIGVLREWILRAYRPREEYGLTGIHLDFEVTNREIRLTFEALERGGYIVLPGGLVPTLAGHADGFAVTPKGTELLRSLTAEAGQ